MPKTTDGKAAKKVKDPNKPKGKLSAFMYFSADQRITLKTEQPGKAAVSCNLAHAVAAGLCGWQAEKEAELGVAALALPQSAPRYDWATLGPGGCCRVPCVLSLPLLLFCGVPLGYAARASL